MNTRQIAFALLLTTFGPWGAFTTPGSTPAQESADKDIADLAGDWEITFLGGNVRHYSIDKQGNVTFAEEKRKGRVKRKSEALLLPFEGDSKLERLTMGVDGRLFVEHFDRPEDLVEKMANLIGIGIRLKSPN